MAFIFFKKFTIETIQIGGDTDFFIFVSDHVSLCLYMLSVFLHTSASVYLSLNIPVSPAYFLNLYFSLCLFPFLSSFFFPTFNILSQLHPSKNFFPFINLQTSKTEILKGPSNVYDPGRKLFIDCYPLKILLYCVDTSALYLTSGPNLEIKMQLIPYAGISESFKSKWCREESGINWY